MNIENTLSLLWEGPADSYTTSAWGKKRLEWRELMKGNFWGHCAFLSLRRSRFCKPRGVARGEAPRLRRCLLLQARCWLQLPKTAMCASGLSRLPLLLQISAAPSTPRPPVFSNHTAKGGIRASSGSQYPPRLMPVVHPGCSWVLSLWVFGSQGSALLIAHLLFVRCWSGGRSGTAYDRAGRSRSTTVDCGLNW